LVVGRDQGVLRDPFAIVAALLGIEGLVLLLADWKRTSGWFKYLPSIFWIYFLPMIANTLGLLPEALSARNPQGTAVYETISTYLLPPCLVLLLLPVDIRAILRLGPIALGVMLAGSLGTFVGAVATYAIFGRWLPAEMYKGFGALSASWIGGSANMIAVARGTQTPDSVYLPMVVVDTVVPYAWMAMLIVMAARQRAYDRWNRSRVELVDELARRSRTEVQTRQPVSLPHLAGMLALAAAVGAACLQLGPVLVRCQESLGIPTQFINGYGWAIILATTGGIALSFTPARRLEGYGASKLGYFLLYLVLTSIGARTSLAHIAAAPLLIVAGVVWICIHGVILMGAGRLMRAPMSLLAAASQANIGGPASAPVVAGIYQSGLAPVGLLLAILGNILGTYAGLLCTAVCAWVSRM
jgi:uncharacterized membrane protein